MPSYYMDCSIHIERGIWIENRESEEQMEDGEKAQLRADVEWLVGEVEGSVMIMTTMVNNAQNEERSTQIDEDN